MGVVIGRRMMPRRDGTMKWKDKGASEKYWKTMRENLKMSGINQWNGDSVKLNIVAEAVW